MKNAIIILLLVSSSSYAQEIFSGKMLDKSSKESLSYVNIGVVGKNIGTVSNYNGDFQIELDKKYDNDTLKISMIGYKSLTFKVSNFKSLIHKNSSLQMEEEITELKEFAVSSKRLKEKILGNKNTTKSVGLGFSSNSLGNEIGVKIKIKRSPTYLENFNVSIIKNDFDSLKFRLNFYDLKDGLPNKSLLNENIIVVSQIKEGTLTVDLNDYNIVVYDDFFVSMEWIENLGDNDGLTFSTGVLGNATIVRAASQDNWKKIGVVSVGFNVTAKY